MPKQQHFVCALCESSSAGAAVVQAASDRAICTWCEHELRRLGRTRCRACNTPKPLAAFGSDPRRCKACKAARQRARYHANPALRAQQAARGARWRAANTEHLRGYRAANQPRYSSLKRQRYQRDPAYAERMRAYNRRFRATRLDEGRAYWHQRGRTLAKLRTLQRLRGAR